MEDKILSFKKPTQVAFWDVDGSHYTGGIAYGTEIICGCCGAIIEIEEVYEFAPEGRTPIVVYNDWEPFDDFIIAYDEHYFEIEQEN